MKALRKTSLIGFTCFLMAGSALGQGKDEAPADLQASASKPPVREVRPQTVLNGAFIHSFASLERDGRWASFKRLIPKLLKALLRAGPTPLIRALTADQIQEINQGRATATQPAKERPSISLNALYFALVGQPYTLPMWHTEETALQLLQDYLGLFGDQQLAVLTSGLINIFAPLINFTTEQSADPQNLSTLLLSLIHNIHAVLSVPNYTPLTDAPPSFPSALATNTIDYHFLTEETVRAPSEEGSDEEATSSEEDPCAATSLSIMSSESSADSPPERATLIPAAAALSPATPATARRQRGAHQPRAEQRERRAAQSSASETSSTAAPAPSSAQNITSQPTQHRRQPSNGGSCILPDSAPKDAAI